MSFWFLVSSKKPGETPGLFICEASFSRPYGTWIYGHTSPALKCRAIFIPSRRDGLEASNHQNAES
jgi:hypothetical protein